MPAGMSDDDYRRMVDGMSDQELYMFAIRLGNMFWMPSNQNASVASTSVEDILFEWDPVVVGVRKRPPRKHNQYSDEVTQSLNLSRRLLIDHDDASVREEEAARTAKIMTMLSNLTDGVYFCTDHRGTVAAIHIIKGKAVGILDFFHCFSIQMIIEDSSEESINKNINELMMIWVDTVCSKMSERCGMRVQVMTTNDLPGNMRI